MKITITLDVPDGTRVLSVSPVEQEPAFIPYPDTIPVPGDPVPAGVNLAPGFAAGAALTQGPPQAWAVGQVHEPGHQPLKAGNKGGLFCPSKIGQNPDGSAIWCRFRVP